MLFFFKCLVLDQTNNIFCSSYFSSVLSTCLKTCLKKKRPSYKNKIEGHFSIYYALFFCFYKRTKKHVDCKVKWKRLCFVTGSSIAYCKRPPQVHCFAICSFAFPISVPKVIDSTHGCT